MMYGHYAIFRLLILLFWIVFFLYWIISAQGTKKVISRVQFARFFFVLIIVVNIAIVVFVPREVRAQFVPRSYPIQIAGTILTALGIAFAIWARIHIGKNWSSGPSVQEGHQLVTSGPYRMVRHPIYTGVLLALFGSAFVAGLIGLSNFIMVMISFLWRIKEEEKIMTQLFPQQYPEYKKGTKALIPFIW